MKRSDWITIITMAVGFVITITTVSFKIGGIHEKIISMEKTVDGHTEELREVRVDISKIRTDMGEMNVKLDMLWRRHLDQAFPNSVPKGAILKDLQRSQVTQFANQHYSEILSKVKSFEPENAGQAKEVLISVVGNYKKSDEHRLTLHNAAVAAGYDIDSLLFAAAMSISDRVVADLGF